MKGGSHPGDGRSFHSRFGPVMWGAIGIAFMVLAIVTVSGLDSRIAGYTVGVLVLVCLAVCGLAFWLDGRSSRATARLLDRMDRSDR